MVENKILTSTPIQNTKATQTLEVDEWQQMEGMTTTRSAIHRISNSVCGGSVWSKPLVGYV